MAQDKDCLIISCMLSFLEIYETGQLGPILRGLRPPHCVKKAYQLPAIQHPWSPPLMIYRKLRWINLNAYSNETAIHGRTLISLEDPVWWP